MVFSSQMVQIEDLKPRRAATVRYWTASCFGTACCQLSFTWIKIWCSSDMKSWRWRSYWVGPWNTRGETKPWDIIGFSGPSRNLSSWITHQWSSEKTLMFMASASQILRGRRCRWNMIGETKMIKEKHIMTISIICLNSTVLIYQYQNNTKRQWCFFLKKLTGCVFPFQRSPVAKDYNRHAYQWLPAPLEAPKLPVIYPNDGHHFSTPTRYPKVMKFTSVGNLSFFKSGSSGSAYLLLICIFFYQIRQIRSCSLQFPGRGSESCLNSWGASYSRSRIRFEVMSPEATPKKPNHRVSSPKWSLLQHCLPPKVSFFCRYLKDLKVLDVETSDVLFFSKLSTFEIEIAFLFPLPLRSTMAFPPTLGWATLGPSTVGGKSFRWSRLPTCRFGSWGLEAFRKAIEKAMEKIMEADIFENMTGWSLFFSNSAVQHRFSFNPISILLKKSRDFLTVSEGLFCFERFQCWNFHLSGIYDGRGARGTPEAGTAAAARGTHGCRTGSSWPRWCTFNGKKTNCCEK